MDFTGAPYYAGSASLKFGGDLSYVFCAKQAAIPIKSYSPELMVTSFYDDDAIWRSSAKGMAATVIEFFPRLHCLVIGPGLGRKEKVLEAVKAICVKAKETSLPLVLDADALYMLSLSTGNLDIIKGYTKCIITPNVMEFDRLLNASKLCLPEDATQAHKVIALAKYLEGPTVLVKGAEDLVADGVTDGRGGWIVYQVEEKGSMRRSGGQGDILAGSLGTAFHWALNYPCEHDMGEEGGEVGYRPGMNAAFLASIVVKRASAAAFKEHSRSMTSPDVLRMIGEAMHSIEEEEACPDLDFLDSEEK